MDMTRLAGGGLRQQQPWNKGRLTGAKPPLQPKHVWAIRTRLQISGLVRDLALFNLAIDSKLAMVASRPTSPYLPGPPNADCQLDRLLHLIRGDCGRKCDCT